MILIKFLFYFFILLFPFIGYSQDLNSQHTDWKKIDLRGKVKSIEKILYEPKDGNTKNLSDKQIVNGWYIGEYPKITKFNQNGYIISETEYKSLSQKKKYSEKIFVYDQENKIDSISLCTWGCFSKTFYSFQYESKGDTLIQNKILNKEVFYDPNGSISSLLPTQIYPKGILKQTSFYNNMGQLIKRINYDLDSIISEKNIYKYDKKGNLTTHKRLVYKKSRHTHKRHLEDIFSSVTKYSYNDKNLLKVKEKYGLKNDSLEGKTIYKYDKLNNIIEIRSNDRYITDSHRRDPVIIQKGSGFNPDGGLVYLQRYSYKYDEKGNWIERQELKKDTIQFVTKRYIDYY